MALRLILVSAVTSLGLDLPSEGQCERWTRSGCSWAVSTWPWASGAMPPGMETNLCGEDSTAEAVREDLQSGTNDPGGSDAAFASVVEQMTAEFLRDETLPAFEEPVDSRIVVIDEEKAPSVAESVVTDEADDLYPGLAHALNRGAEGLGPISEANPTATAMRSGVDGRSAASETSGRLASAVNLTGQALHAWLSLLQAPAVMLRE